LISKSWHDIFWKDWSILIPQEANTSKRLGPTGFPGEEEGVGSQSQKESLGGATALDSIEAGIKEGGLERKSQRLQLGCKKAPVWPI
jgi:hypothetical protein